MLAVIFKFKSDFKIIFESIYKGNGQLTKILVITSGSTAVTAIPLMYIVRGFANGGIMNGLVGLMLIITGLILRLPSGGKRNLYELRLLEIVLLGLIQGFAIIPAVLGAVILGGSVEGVALISAFIVVSTTFVVGYLTMDLLLRFARKTNFSTFCISLGMISIITTSILMF